MAEIKTSAASEDDEMFTLPLLDRTVSKKLERYELNEEPSFEGPLTGNIVSQGLPRLRRTAASHSPNGLAFVRSAFVAFL